MQRLQARLNDTDFTFLTFEELIRERAVPNGTRLQILSLRSFKEALDDVWTEVAHTVLLAAENTISLRLRPADVCTREADDTFLFEFAAQQPEDARSKVEEITTALMTCLIGDRFAGVRVQLAEIDVQEILSETGELDPEKLDAVIRHADTFVLESGTIRPLSDDPASLPNDADGWHRIVHWWDALERQLRQSKAAEAASTEEPLGWQAVPATPAALPGWQAVPPGEMTGPGRLSGGGADRDARVGPALPVDPRPAPAWAAIPSAPANVELEPVALGGGPKRHPEWSDLVPGDHAADTGEASREAVGAQRPDWRRIDASQSPAEAWQQVEGKGRMPPDWRKVTTKRSAEEFVETADEKGTATEGAEAPARKRTASAPVWEEGKKRPRKPEAPVAASETRPDRAPEVLDHSDTVVDKSGRLAGGNWSGGVPEPPYADWRGGKVAADRPPDWQSMEGHRSRVSAASYQPIAKEIKRTAIDGHTLAPGSDWVPLRWPPPSLLRGASIPELEMQPLPAGQVIGYLPTMDVPRRRVDTYVTVPLERSPDGHSWVASKGMGGDPDAAARLDFALLYTTLDQTEKNIEHRRGLQMIVPIHGSTLCPPYLETVSAILRSFPDASRARYLTLEVASWPKAMPDEALARISRDAGRRVRQMVLRVDRNGPSAAALNGLDPAALGVDLVRGDPDLLAFFLSRFERLRSFLWGVHRQEDRHLLRQGQHWLANGDALWAPVHSPRPPQDAIL